MRRYNVRRKAQLGLDIREGGIAIPIAPNMYYMDGRSHDNGGIAIGPNNKNGLEVEGGEVVKVGNNDIKVFSSVPLLRGVSPAQLVLGGANPNKVFKAQEEFKDRNRINDDGTTYEIGGEKRIYELSDIQKNQYARTGKLNITGYPITPLTKGYNTLRALGRFRTTFKKSLSTGEAINNTVKGWINDVTKNTKQNPSKTASLIKSIHNSFIGKRQENLGLLHENTEDRVIKKKFGGQDDTKTAALKRLKAKHTIKGVYGGGESGGAGAGSVIMEIPEYVNDTIVKRYLVPVTQNFNDAFGDAVNAGLDKFIFNNKWYNTKKGNNPNNNAAGTSRTQTVYLPVEHKEVKRRKKEYGGNMIYTINGNVKNGLMNVRPKAQYGLANKYLKKKNISNEEKPKTVSNEVKENYDFKNELKTAVGAIGGLTAAGVTDYGLSKLKNYFNSTIEPSLEISQEALDKYNENYIRKTQGKTNKGFTPRNPLKSSNNIQYQRLDINEHNIGLYDSKDPIVRATIKARGLNPDRVTANGSFVRQTSNLSEAEQRNLDKVYRKAVGNKEPKSGFGAKPADKVITAEYPNTSISSKPTNVVGKTYDPTVEFRQANKPKPTVNTGLNNYLRKLGKGVKGLGVVGSLLDIYNNLFPSEEAELLEDLRVRMKEQSTPGTRMYKYGGRAKADYGKFLKYKNGIFIDPETGEEYDVDPEVFKMYGNSFEEGVIPMNDYTKGTFDNARPQYYAKKRLPLFGSQSIAEKAGLTKSGWSYADNPTFDYVPKINISVPTNRVKVVGNNAKKSTSSTPRGGESKSAVTTKSKTEPAYINYTPNKVNLAVEADNPTSRTLTKINTPPTGSGTQSKDGNWIPQYNLITGRDWLGVGTNLAGHIASYFANKDILDRYPMPVKPIMTPAVKLKTRVNINPDLTNSKEAELMGIEATNRNTSSSNTALARNQRIMNESRDARNKLYAYKENAETRLINQDRLNRQGIYAKNVAAYNDWLNKTFIAETNKLLGKQQNLMNLINGIPMAVNNVLGNIETRKLTNDMIRAIATSKPDVDGRLLGIGDYYTQQLANGKIAKYNKNHKFIKYL